MYQTSFSTLAILGVLIALAGPADALPRNAIYECDMPAEADVPAYESPSIYIDPGKCKQVAACVFLKRRLVCFPVDGSTRKEAASALNKLRIRAPILTKGKAK